MPESIPTTVASYHNESDENFGFAMITFARGTEKHNVKMPFTFEVDVDSLDIGELGWEAASEWPEAGWGTDNPQWGIVEVEVTLPDGTVESLYSR